MTNVERKQVTLELKEIGDNGTFEGLLSVYDVVDEYNDIVERGAYTQTLKSNNNRVPLLWQHDQAMPIGELELADADEGLQAKGRILVDDAVPEGRKAYALLKAGMVRGLSIGFRTIRSKMDGKIRRLKEIRLFEGSLVTIPANRFALVSAVKSLGVEQKDFAAELELIQLYEMNYQIMSALRSALYKAAHSSKLNNDQKIEAATEAIDQFRQVYLEFLPKYLEMEASGMGYMSAEALVERLKAIPDPTRDLLTDFSQKYLEIEGKHPGTSAKPDAASAAPDDSINPTDSDAFRSWVQEQFGS